MNSCGFFESGDEITGSTKFLGSEDECSTLFNRRESPCKIRFLESGDESANDICVQPITPTTVVTRSAVNSNRRRTTRSRFRRLIRNEDDSDDDYLPGSARPILVRRSLRRSRSRAVQSGTPDSVVYDQIRAPLTTSVRPSTPTVLRQPSTRREARRANLRINLMERVVNESADEENSFEEENVVHVDEISMASDDCCDKFLTEDETGKEKYPCIICAESEAIRPMKTTCCAQSLGCKTCIKRWYLTTNISELNSRSPLSRGQSHDNHKRCPFCRTPWPTRMLIVAI